MSSPSSTTEPSTRAPGISSCIRLSERRKVDFPQPDEPISAVTRFGWIVMFTSLDGVEGAVVQVEVA